METCFDGSTYVLTTILPISDRIIHNQADDNDDDGNPVKTSRGTDGLVIDFNATQPLSCLHYLQEILAGLPTSNDVPDEFRKELDQWKAPPSLNDRTHFLRWAVITDLAYNGRPRRSFLTQLLEDLRGHRLTDAEPQTRLSRAVLLMSVIFDADDGSDKTVDNYLRELWANMKTELNLILPCLVGFEKENAATSFVQLVRRHQIRPAFSWSDYAWESDDVPEGRYWGALATLLPLVLIPAITVARCSSANPGAWEIALAAALWISAFHWASQRFERLINTPSAVPSSPFDGRAGNDSTQPQTSRLRLRDIRKAMYLRDQMISFLSDLQCVSPDDYPERLHSEFGAFIEAHKPMDTMEKSLMQPAGQTKGPTRSEMGMGDSAVEVIEP